MLLLSDRTKVIRGVMGFLALCALVGFITGLKGALPTEVYEEDAGPVASTPSGVVVEAAQPEDPAAAAEAEAAKKAEEDAAKKKGEEEAAKKAEERAQDEKPAAPATPAPSEEAPPSDPVGELLEQQPAPAPPAPAIY